MAKIQVPTSTAEILPLLRLFNEQASRLYAYNFHREACAPGNGFNIEFGVDKPTVGTKVGATEEATSAVILILRKLIQPRDKISFEKIVAMHRYLPIPAERLERSAALYSALKTFLAVPTGCGVNDWKPTNWDLFETFVYGMYAHHNDEHVAHYNSIINGPFAAMLESLFEDIVITFIEYALCYKVLNETILALLEPTS